MEDKEKTFMDRRPALFSSNLDGYETPQWLFDELNKEFNFTLDPCCTPQTAKCDKYYTKKENGLIQNWEGEVVFINPPYGREIPKWVKKGYEEYLKGVTTVFLLPSRTDTRWFHDYATKGEIRFIKGRLRFKGAVGGTSNDAPFPSIILIFGKEYYPNTISFLQPRHR